MRPPEFDTYDAVREWARANEACPACGEQRASKGFLCSEHALGWGDFATETRIKKNSKEVTANDLYLEFVTLTQREVNADRHVCAGCGSGCPEDDYLCGSCRGSS
jgi:hypothetical protein